MLCGGSYPVAHYWESFATALISGLLSRVVNNVRVGNGTLSSPLLFDFVFLCATSLSSLLLEAISHLHLCSSFFFVCAHAWPAPFDSLIPWDYTSARLGVSVFEFACFAAIGALGGVRLLPNESQRDIIRERGSDVVWQLVSAGFVWAHAGTVRLMRRLQPKSQRSLSCVIASLASVAVIERVVLG
jgi:hypothetical protein